MNKVDTQRKVISIRLKPDYLERVEKMAEEKKTTKTKILESGLVLLFEKEAEKAE